MNITDNEHFNTVRDYCSQARTTKPWLAFEWLEIQIKEMELQLAEPRDKLRMLLTQCTEKQQERFADMFKGVDAIANKRLPSVIKVIERTIVRNKERGDDK